MGEHTCRSGRMLSQHRILVHRHGGHGGRGRGCRVIAVGGERVLAGRGRSRRSQVSVRGH